MNYSRKKSDGVFSNLFSGTIKSLLILTVVCLICISTNKASVDIREEAFAKAEPVGVQVSAACEEDNSDINTEDEEFINPAEGVLTSAFGQRWGRMHNGIDIGAELDAEIYATGDGVVTFAGVADGYGNYIVIDHGNGCESAYAHCSSLAVSTGEAVIGGQVIGYIGSTGNSTGPHLHFEIRIDGEYRNPLDYVVY